MMNNFNTEYNLNSKSKINRRSSKIQVDKKPEKTEESGQKDDLKSKKKNTLLDKTIKKKTEEFYKLFTVLPNGVSIYSSKTIESFYFSFNKLGSFLDYKIGINGMAHFFEHFIFKDAYIESKLNATTKFNSMMFYTNYQDYQQFLKLISFFYDISDTENLKIVEKINTKEYFKDAYDLIDNIRKELENEYYYRNVKRYANNCLNVMYGKPLYIGGRFEDFNDPDEIIKQIKNIWNNIDGKDIFFIIPEKYLDESTEIILRTFGTKKKTYHFKEFTTKLKPPILNPKIENPYICATSDSLFYELLFKFNYNELEEVRKNILILNYFTNFLWSISLSIIGSEVIVKFYSSNENRFKLLLFLIKNNSFTNLLDINNLDEIINFIPLKYYEDEVIFEMILEYENIKKISKLTPIDMIANVQSFFERLNTKLIKYGNFMAFLPDNHFINTNFDIYNNPYNVFCSSLNSLDDKNHFDTDIYNVFNKKWKYSNVYGNNNTFFKDCTCKKNIIIRDNPNDKKYRLKISNELLKCPWIYDKEVNIIKNINPKNNNKELLLFSNNPILLSRIQQEVNYSIMNTMEYSTSFIDIDVLSNAFSYYLLNTSPPKMEELIYMIQNRINPKLQNYNNCSISFTNDRLIKINTPYNFIIIFFKLPTYTDFNLTLLSHYLKTQGFIYSGREKIINDMYNNLYYLFYPTMYINEVLTYTNNYINSYQFDCPIVNIISTKSTNYDFTNLDSSSFFIKIV